MVINTCLACPFYVAPVLFPKKTWLGLAPVLVGFSQIVLHGIFIPQKAGATYGPRVLTALLLHLPIGIGYVKCVGQGGSLGRADWAKGLGGAVSSAVFGMAVPTMVMRDPNSPYAFTAKQMGRYDVSAFSDVSFWDKTVANVWVSPGQRADT
jgi:hypothetical protein